MRKSGLIFLLLFVSAVTCFSLTYVHAQSSGDLGKIIGEDNIESIKNISQGEFLAKEWKRVLLANKYIASGDKFFIKINWLFVSLFARDYEFSLTFFFIFCIWLFTFISLIGYFGSMRIPSVISNIFDFGEGAGEELFALLAGMLGTIAIAWTGVFNRAGAAVRNVVFYGENTWIRGVMWFLFFAALLICLYLNRAIAKKLRNDKEKHKQEKLEQEVAVNTAYRRRRMENV